MKNNENNIFVDTNCLIGFLCDKHNLRKKADEYNTNAIKYLLKQTGKRLYISSLSIAQLTATFQKRMSREELISDIKWLVSRFNVVEFNKSDITIAIDSICMKDVEDSYQYQMSQKTRCLYILTNNSKDFSCFYNVSICTPKTVRKMIFD